MMRGLLTPLAAIALLTGCASVPAGPSVMVLPGDRATFHQFTVDEAACRRWAERQTGISAADAGNQTAVAGAAIGTAVGAAAGAAIGAAAGGPAAGAAIGAGVGLLGGSAIGADYAYAAAGSIQRRYDAAYMQCMYASGHQIPVPRGSVVRRPAPTAATPPPPAPGIPAPPAGTPPPAPGTPPAGPAPSRIPLPPPGAPPDPPPPTR